MKTTKSISWFLGISMFMFGFLKFFNPFKQWYTAQITGSGLGNGAYIMGIAGEIIVGLILLYTMIRWQALTINHKSILITITSALVVAMMTTGIYVHLQPEVPAEVLPMNIKPPYIPGFFMLLGVINIWRAQAMRYTNQRSGV